MILILMKAYLILHPFLLELEYFMVTRSIPWLVMPWLLVPQATQVLPMQYRWEITTQITTLTSVLSTKLLCHCRMQVWQQWSLVKSVQWFSNAFSGGSAYMCLSVLATELQSPFSSSYVRDHHDKKLNWLGTMMKTGTYLASYGKCCNS